MYVSGGIFPIEGTKFKAPELGPVAIMAVKDINNNPNILPKHKLVLDIQDGQCEADVVMKKFIDFIKNKDPSRFRSTVGILGNEYWRLNTKVRRTEEKSFTNRDNERGIKPFIFLCIISKQLRLLLVFRYF